MNFGVLDWKFWLLAKTGLANSGIILHFVAVLFLKSKVFLSITAVLPYFELKEPLRSMEFKQFSGPGH